MIEGIEWTRALADQLDIGPVLEKLMAIQTAFEAAEPPHETEGDADFRKVYEGSEFYDDLIGVLLDRELAIKARRVEIDFFKARGMYTKCRREPWMNVITTKLLDVNKGDAESPNIRCRLVVRGIAARLNFLAQDRVDMQ